MRLVFKEVSNTSISRERFIDFIKTLGLIMLVFNSFFYLEFNFSGGEQFIFNNSDTSETYIVISWFTAGFALFFFSMGFNNLIAWYSNVGRDGSQWNYLVDRINSILGPTIVWVITSSIFLNILVRTVTYPKFLTTSEDGLVSSIEFVLWPLWLVAIYLVLVLFAPLTIYLHKKYPYISLGILVIITMFIDAVNLPINFSYLKVLNYLFFWLTIHQFGYFYADGKVQLINKNIFTFTSIISFGYLFYKLSFSNEYLSMVSYRLTSISNEDPPTTLFLITSVGLISFFLSLRFKIENFFTNDKKWLIFSHIHSNIYTLFFWHLVILFIVYLLGINNVYSPSLLLIIVLIFGNYERSVFKLSTNLVKRVNPLQPWPTPIKARISISNFTLAWVSAFLILLGVVNVSLGGIGQDGFFSLREFYFIRSNTFEGLGRILIGLLLLNITVRGLKYKKRILFLAIIFSIVALYSRILISEPINNFEVAFTSLISMFFIILLFLNSNYKFKSKVK